MRRTTRLEPRKFVTLTFLKYSFRENSNAVTNIKQQQKKSYKKNIKFKITPQTKPAKNEGIIAGKRRKVGKNRSARI